MTKSRLMTAALLVLLVVAPTGTQQREKKAGPPDFKKEMEAALKAFEAQKYGACVAHVKRARSVVNLLRRKQVLAAFPTLGEEFQVQDGKNYEEAMNNPMAGMLPASFAGIIERTYKAGKKRIKVTLTLDAPQAKAYLSMMDMMRGKNTEVITYKANKALLEKSGKDRFKLTMVLNGAHSLVADARNVSDDDLLKMFSQATLDRLSSAIAE